MRGIIGYLSLTHLFWAIIFYKWCKLSCQGRKIWTCVKERKVAEQNVLWNTIGCIGQGRLTAVTKTPKSQWLGTLRFISHWRESFTVFAECVGFHTVDPGSFHIVAPLSSGPPHPCRSTRGQRMPSQRWRAPGEGLTGWVWGRHVSSTHTPLATWGRLRCVL